MHVCHRVVRVSECVSVYIKWDRMKFVCWFSVVVPILWCFFIFLFANWHFSARVYFSLSLIKIRLKPIRFASQTFTLCSPFNGVFFDVVVVIISVGKCLHTHKQPCFEIQCYYTAMDHRYDVILCVNVSINSVQRDTDSVLINSSQWSDCVYRDVESVRRVELKQTICRNVSFCFVRHLFLKTFKRTIVNLKKNIHRKRSLPFKLVSILSENSLKKQFNLHLNWVFEKNKYTEFIISFWCVEYCLCVQNNTDWLVNFWLYYIHVHLLSFQLLPQIDIKNLFQLLLNIWNKFNKVAFILDSQFYYCPYTNILKMSEHIWILNRLRIHLKARHKLQRITAEHY